jgi:hypothetical protein
MRREAGTERQRADWEAPPLRRRSKKGATASAARRR